MREWRAVGQSDDVDKAVDMAVGPDPLYVARRLYRERARRHDAFPNLDECGWDMLVLLFVAKGEERKICVSSLCSASFGSLTTGLRRMAELIACGFIERTADPLDGRRAWVSLTAEGVVAVSDCLSAMARDERLYLGGRARRP